MGQKPSNIRIIFYLISNVILSLMIILLNKWIYVHINFPNVTLSMLHFIVTFLGLFVCEKCNVFNVKSVHFNDIILLAVSFCGFVVFTNLSLQNNTVGTFQVAKVLTTPGVVFIQMIFYGKIFSWSVKFTFVPIIVGVIINFYYDIHFNVIGTIYAMLGVVITSLYQVLVNSKQSELQMNSMQLLYYQAPLSAVILFVCIFFVEPPLETIKHNWTLTELCMVLISCLVALFCNLSSYWIIGNTSPLTYNMLGHTKFVSITIGGWLLFDSTISTNQFMGIALTLFGIVLYVHIRMNETKVPATFTKIEEVKT